MTLELGKTPRYRFGAIDPEADAAAATANQRTVPYVLSTPAVARDLDTIAVNAWRYANFQRNPVFLWAHDATQPPIGRIVAIETVGQALKGVVEYIERDVHPFADTIFQLVKKRFLNAVSVSWFPLKWELTRDKSRPGGIDFTEVDLLEVSQVPVPADPNALAEARRQGIDTTPIVEWAERMLDGGARVLIPRNELEELRRAAKMATKPARASADWKVGASRDLPIEDTDSWDGDAAAASIFEWAGGDSFDGEKARKGFLFYDAAAADKRGSYRDPIAHVVAGELKVPKGAIKAAAARISQTDVPDDVKKRGQGVIDAYKEKAGIGDGSDDEATRALKARHDRALKRAPAVPNFRRGLYEVSQLAWELQCLGYLHDCTAYEAALEGDGSPVPAMLGEALKQLGEALIAMTAEEVTELLEGKTDEAEDGEQVEIVEISVEARQFVAAGKTARSRAWRRGIALARAGKVLSATNQSRLEEANNNHERAMKHARAVGESHEAAGEQMGAIAEAHRKVRAAHEELGDAIEAARATPEKASEHLDRAAKQHDALDEHMTAAEDARRQAVDHHEDAGDAHRCMGRSVKAAQRNVRAVLDGAVPADDGEDDGVAGDNSKSSQDDGAAARAARLERLTRIQAAGVTPAA